MINNVFREHENLTERRKQQIDTLKIFNDNVTEVIEDAEYKVEFECGGKCMVLSVCLGSKFPLEKPILKISPPVSHPWIKHGNEVSLAPGLLNFTVHSDLGRVVQAVVREFELRPPPLFEKPVSQPNQQGNNGETIPAPTTSVASSNYLFTTTASTALLYKDFTYPSRIASSSPQAMSLIFPELNGMPMTELKELNENPRRLDELINSLPTKQALNRNLDEWICTVEKLAKENLSREPLLFKLKVEIEEKLKILQEAKSEYDRCSLEYRLLCERFNPTSIRESLRQSLAKVDEESEQIAEMFLAGEMDLDSFLTDYISHRMISYSRKAKDEKLSQQLEKLQQAGF